MAAVENFNVLQSQYFRLSTDAPVGPIFTFNSEGSAIWVRKFKFNI